MGSFSFLQNLLPLGKSAFMRYLFLFSVLIIYYGCKKDLATEEPMETIPDWEHEYEAISLLGDTLYASDPSEELIARFTEKDSAYKANPGLENLIWYGRFIAYQGKYREAIRLYSEGLQKFPNESRILRHRGHRYISVREFEKAIADLSKAAELIQGKENMIEQDGMPNAQGIPVSTMHGNIYYHLGLAHYLNGDMKAALEAYDKCLNTSHNADNVVSATHWLYMISRKLGDEELADSYLQRIQMEMNVIENHSYHNACLFYKGEKSMEEVYDPSSEDSPSNSAVKYAVGNWLLYNGRTEEALEVLTDITSGPDWASFGFIAAEADLAGME